MGEAMFLLIFSGIRCQAGPPIADCSDMWCIPSHQTQLSSLLDI